MLLDSSVSKFVFFSGNALEKLVSNINAKEGNVWPLLDRLFEPVVILSRDLRIERANPPFFRLLDKEPERIYGRPCREFLCRSEDPRTCRARGCPADRAFRSNKTLFTEKVYERDNGEPIHAKVMILPIGDGADGPSHVLMAIHDITRERVQEEELAVARKEKERLFQLGTDGILRMDDGFVIRDANRNASDMTGYGLADLVGKNFLSMLEAEGRPQVVEACEEIRENESRRVCPEIELIRADGSRRVCEVCLNFEEDKGGALMHVHLRDLSERVRMETKLREVNDFLTSLIESSVDGVVAADMTGTVIIFNKGAERLLGYRADEVIGRANAKSFYPPGVAQEIMRKLRDERWGGVGRLSSQRFTGLTKRGEQIPFTLSGALIYRDGEEIASVGFFYDLREIHRVQQELLESEIKFRNLFETVQHGLFFSTLEGRFQDCNQALVDMLGYADKEELMGIDIPRDLYLDPSYRREFQEKVEVAGFVKDYEVQFKKKSGEPIHVLLTAHMKRAASGDIVGYQGLVVDVTERLRLEQQLFQSAKMASLGKLAAGVAHEINNPLGAISIFANLVLEKTPEEDPRRPHLQKIAQASERCKEIVKGLLKFSRQTEPDFVHTNLGRIIRNVLFLFKGQALFHNIEIVEELEESPQVVADIPLMEQVFTNIIINAAEALDGKGTIRVRTAPSADGAFVEAQITDDGPGIPEKDLGRIFEPFFTTKDPSSMGSGTGLGLAISYGIVEKHGGTISVSSEPGTGTTFTIRLPVAC